MILCKLKLGTKIFKICCENVVYLDLRLYEVTAIQFPIDDDLQGRASGQYERYLI